MKKAFKIVALILFMIGLCSVQPNYGVITLVDNDVGDELTTNLNSLDATILTATIEDPCQVMAPLKYPLIVSEIIIANIKDQDVYVDFANDYLYGYSVIINQQKIMAETNPTNSIKSSKQNQLKECLISASEYIFLLVGRYRLNIGDNLHKTIIC